jgi:hypothetical protein
VKDRQLEELLTIGKLIGIDEVEGRVASIISTSTDIGTVVKVKRTWADSEAFDLFAVRLLACSVALDVSDTPDVRARGQREVL